MCVCLIKIVFGNYEQNWWKVSMNEKIYLLLIRISLKIMIIIDEKHWMKKYICLIQSVLGNYGQKVRNSEWKLSA